ncbi:MAG: GNAT family N-acetyltransferase [Eubacteriales bacterium]|nr:GNAT family N-acetyltransferase [Eubacteriales bacterium]
MEFLDILTHGSRYREQVYALYEEAFPEEEKKPTALLETLQKQGKMELLAIEENGEFIGLAMNMLAGKTALLDYFAIASDKRDGGNGSRAVRALQERFKNQKYIFEIEMQDENASNAEDRRRRKAFYLRNGLKETGVFANVYQTDFELLTPDGSLTYEEYVEMLLCILGQEGVDILNPHIIEPEKK